jgi:hypothetical protein
VIARRAAFEIDCAMRWASGAIADGARGVDRRRGGVARGAAFEIDCAMRWIWVVAVVLACGSHDARAEAWGTSDYVAAGVPDPAGAWSSAKLKTAVDAIDQAAAGHPERLPRYRGAKSGAVFAKLLDRPRDDFSAPVTARLGMHLERFEAFNKASKLYANGLGPPPREQIELFSALLHEAVAIGDLSGPFLATFSRDDPSLPTRRQGLVTFREGVGGMLLGSVMVADNQQVPDADRLVVFGYLADTAPALLPPLPAKVQESVRTYIDKLAAATKGDLHDAAVRVQRAIAPKN